MLMRIPLAVAMLVFAGSHASAQSDAPPPALSPLPEKKICQSIVPTGSIMAKRICLTKTQWREFDGINSNAVDRLSNRTAQPCGTSGGPLSCGN